MTDSTSEIKINQFHPLEELASFSKKVAEEGIVLLENKKNVLPLINQRVAVFGRIQFNYYKSGTGSGGLVNVSKVDSIIESLFKNPRVTIDQSLVQIYQNWIEDHPFDEGSGQWASEPWAQVEMELSNDIIQSISKNNDVAIVIFGRTAGEDRDNHRGRGSYQLSEKEEQLLQQVTNYFKRTVVILNVGNVVDLGFMDQYPISSLVMAWHGGMYGADALVDVLTGYVSPSGKLPMTIAKSIDFYPSNHNFGQLGKVIYEEDIYVGYRYFETFNQSAVRYPFGYGLSYSKFSYKPLTFDIKNEQVKLSIEVTNVGSYRAKEVVQIYHQPPQGQLGKPTRNLIGFVKTNHLNPNQKEIVKISIPLKNLASYDDVGLIYKSAYVLEKGPYQILIGFDSRHAKKAFQIQLQDDIITEVLSEASAPNEPFKRLKPSHNLEHTYENVPLRTVNYNQHIQQQLPKPLPQSNKSYSLLDVHHQKITLDQFIETLSVTEMIEITRGEGMSSPKVTPGTAAAFGGVTEGLKKRGIPIACASDGPSGIRMDSGAYASSLPIGTLQASTFNPKLIEHLYYLEGLEMRGYEIDMLLGPGMNIQRHPLNGRNFEYFSEDPLLTGLMGAATIKGLHQAGVTGTLKHVAANNQETDRFNVNSVVSERALREIYLKGFEIAVKDAKADAIMTSYNPINGLWTASNYDINKTIIRDEWGFTGVIVTDWWAKMNDFGQNEGYKTNTKAMIRSTNDIYMVISDSHSNSNHDNSLESYQQGDLKLAELQVASRHILNYLLKTPAFARMHGIKFTPNIFNNKSWIRTNQKSWNYQKPIELNINEEKMHFNATIYRHHLSVYNQLIPSEKKFKEELTTDLKHLRLVKENKLGDQIYHLSCGINHNQSSLSITNNLDFSPLHQFKSDIWDPFILPIDAYVHKNDGVNINNHVIESTAKDGLVTYAIDVKTYGKYILVLQVSSNSSHIAQLPCSIYVGNDVKSTLTFHGTDGKIIQSNAYIRLDVGKHFITFNFKKSGLTIHEIKCMRHG